MTDPLADIVVPGSTSNLGAGFDALSVALDVYMRVEVLDIQPGERGRLLCEFSGGGPPGENRIETAFRRAEARFGPADAGLQVRVRSDIPMTAGLGSSAAASLAGLALYEIAAGRALATGDVLDTATALDGHPDNVAAALLGGIAVSCGCEGGRVIARCWEWPAEIRFIVATPEAMLHTKDARGVLPDRLPLADAVANLQRALLFIRALETRQYDDLREAVKDRWHQAARASLVPGLADALAITHPAVLGVCLSGAGPSVLALAAPGRDEEAAEVLGAVYRRLGVRHTIRNLGAHGRPLTRSLSTTRRETTA
jgi:homoserine kinase